MTFEEWVEAAGFKYLHPEMRATLHEAYQAGWKDRQARALAKVRARHLAWVKVGPTQTTRLDVVRTHCPGCCGSATQVQGAGTPPVEIPCPGCGHEGEIRALKAELENVQAGNRVLQREIAKVAEHFGMPGDGRLLSEQWIEAYEKVNKERDRANEIAEDLLEALRTG